MSGLSLPLCKMDWSISDIERLKASGKIRGFVAPPAKKIKHEIGGRIVTGVYLTKSKEKNSISINLFEWSQQRAYKLYEEYFFTLERRYRFDWCIPEIKLAIEYEGGLFQKQSGHKSAKGIMRDIEKYRMAEDLGWKVIRLHLLNYSELNHRLNKIQ